MGTSYTSASSTAAGACELVEVILGRGAGVELGTWYCARKVGLGEICDRLNANLDRFPPPQRNRKDENGLRQTWSRSQIQSMLRNPKYTGYNVWNRHDKRPGRSTLRPRDQWVWSPTPVHEPIVSKALFDKVEQPAQRNAAAAKALTARAYTCRPGRAGDGPTSCAVGCAADSVGGAWRAATRRARTGTAASTSPDEAPPRPISPATPASSGVKEEIVLEAIVDFLAARLFGPTRLRLMKDELALAASSDWNAHDAQVDRLAHELVEVDRSLYRRTLRLEEHEDPAHPVVALATRRIEELNARRQAITEAIDKLKAKRPAGGPPTRSPR